ncbi:MAG: hypothetical protein SNJ74_04510 [Fimbriimonadaceae bacterium]
MAYATLDRFDRAFTSWLDRHALTLLRWSLSLVFLWFGVLKLIPGASPAEPLVAQTTQILFFGLLSERTGVGVVGVWEVLIGLGLLSGVWMRATLALLGLQMLGAFSPLVLFPFSTFVQPPFAPTLEGQYIVKNVVLVSAALVLGSRVREIDRRRERRVGVGRPASGG